jgi:hypothetical protein
MPKFLPVPLQSFNMLCIKEMGTVLPILFTTNAAFVNSV